MYYYYHKKQYPDAILIYIEEYNRINRTVLFDFVDSNEFAIFAQNINLDRSSTGASMVLITNYIGRRVQENTVYAISLTTLKLWHSEQAITTENNSFLIGYNIELNSNQQQVFDRSVTIGEFDDFQLLSHMTGNGHNSNLPFTANGQISVVIRNVGQGNWNEIHTNNAVNVIFDAGAPFNAARSQVLGIIGNRPLTYARDKPGLILSHWDKDHYHSLIGMTDAELSGFSYFICRDRVPNYTSRILFVRIKNAVGAANTFCIPAIARTRRGGYTSLVPLTASHQQHILFNSQHHKNRNISGIVLALRTSTSSMILSGDSLYEQLQTDVIPHLNYPHGHNLIVPHHGGNAGIYNYRLPSGVNPLDAIISVGPNTYGHPMWSNTNALTTTGFLTKRTDKIGDISIIL
jgi:beta-lactamase superfamily II metal-dependent hydrolase